MSPVTPIKGLKTIVVHVAFPPQYKPLLFHGQVTSKPMKCIGFHTLRRFNLSHSKRR